MEDKKNFKEKGFKDLIKSLESIEIPSEGNFIVKYLWKEDDSLIGYHANTIGEMTQDRNLAKRYTGDPYKQMQQIAINAKDTIEYIPKKEVYKPLNIVLQEAILNVKEEHYKNMVMVPEPNWYLDFEDLSGFEPEQKRSYKIIS